MDGTNNRIRIMTNKDTPSSANIEKVISLDKCGEILLNKQQDEVKQIFSDSIKLMSMDDDTSISSIRKDKFYASEDNHIPPYILTVEIDTTVIDKLVSTNRLSLKVSVTYFDGVTDPTIFSYANYMLTREELTVPNDKIANSVSDFLKSHIAEAYKMDGEYDTSRFPLEEEAKLQLKEMREQLFEAQEKFFNDLNDIKDKVVRGVRRFALKALATSACVIGGTILTFTALSLIRRKFK